MEKWLKGEDFVNRYRFTGTLVTYSPLHIGTGASIGRGRKKDNSSQAQSGGAYGGKEEQKTTEVSSIMRDFKGKPIIPGSTLRGVIRHWLSSILTGFAPELATYHEYTSDDFTQLSQEEQITLVKEQFSWLELLFGTPFHEGKVEFWDATCKTESLGTLKSDDMLGWNAEKLTYQTTSVAINPKTGTAVENLLYTAEVVPPGVEFEFNVVGQNLSELEIGIILLALQGFNSDIYPIQIGARSGRGYGRMRFTLGKVYGITAEQMGEWIASLIQTFETEDAERKAGYYALPEIGAEEQKRLLREAKEAFLEARYKSEHNGA